MVFKRFYPSFTLAWVLWRQGLPALFTSLALMPNLVLNRWQALIVCWRRDKTFNLSKCLCNHGILMAFAAMGFAVQVGMWMDRWVSGAHKLRQRLLSGLKRGLKEATADRGLPSSHQGCHQLSEIMLSSLVPISARGCASHRSTQARNPVPEAFPSNWLPSHAVWFWSVFRQERIIFTI